jgi:hypothetical protein
MRNLVFWERVFWGPKGKEGFTGEKARNMQSVIDYIAMNGGNSNAAARVLGRRTAGDEYQFEEEKMKGYFPQQTDYIDSWNNPATRKAIENERKLAEERGSILLEKQRKAAEKAKAERLMIEQQLQQELFNLEKESVDKIKELHSVNSQEDYANAERLEYLRKFKKEETEQYKYVFDDLQEETKNYIVTVDSLGQRVGDAFCKICYWCFNS